LAVDPVIDNAHDECSLSVSKSSVVPSFTV
jgi:hypothetical protein